MWAGCSLDGTVNRGYGWNVRCETNLLRGPCTLHPIVNPSPYPTAYTLQPTPFNLHPTPFTLPYTIYPTPSSRQVCRGTTKGPMWGYPRPVLGAVDPFLEPFRGRLSPNIDNAS